MAEMCSTATREEGLAEGRMLNEHGKSVSSRNKPVSRVPE